MKAKTAVLLIGAAALGGCGGEDESSTPVIVEPPPPHESEAQEAEAAIEDSRPGTQAQCMYLDERAFSCYITAHGVTGLAAVQLVEDEPEPTLLNCVQDAPLAKAWKWVKAVKCVTSAGFRPRD